MQDLGAANARNERYPLQSAVPIAGSQRFQQEPNQTNPCSALFNIIINIGGAPSQTACIQHDPTNPNSIQLNINNAGPASQRNDANLPTHERQTTQYQREGHVDNTGQVAALQAPVVGYQVSPNEQRLPQMEKSPYGP
eukprot:Seg109.2 transcript_id=Seg109.2/GoldUCD/mRNA.D3Y31 product="hypothetical protein" protein_id=Seg109.2/GoldUCD/D3Y31